MPASKKGTLREKYSCFIGGVVPDPRTMLHSQERIKNFKTDLKNMTHKSFAYTGDSFNKW